MLSLARAVDIRMRVMKSKRTKDPVKRREGGPGRRPIVSITEHQRWTLREIQDFIAHKGYLPTIQDLAETLGCILGKVVDVRRLNLGGRASFICT